MTAILKKELMSYIHSMTGWLFIAVTICLFAMYAAVYNISYGSPYIAYSLDSIIILFFITVPVLSMRIIAEERKQKTDQLLCTAPTRAGKIVLGKYFAMAVIFLIPTALFCLFPLFLSRYGVVPMAESYVAVLAFTLYGLAAIAVGMFISSLTENQVIAAVISFLILFTTYMMQGIESLIPDTGNIVIRFLGAFDFYSHYSGMVNSVTDITGTSQVNTIFNISTVIYFLSIIILMLFLTAQATCKRKYITGIIAIALAVAINLAADRLPESYTSIDITSNQLYGITEQTRTLVSGLDEDVTIYVLSSEEDTDGILKQMLAKYKELSDYININYIDPLLNPLFTSKYTTDTSIAQDSIIVETGKRYKVISYTDMYEMEFDYYTYQQYVTGYDGEGQLTSAIAYCISDDMPKLYIIAGHNEYTLDTGFITAIEKENIDYETISLMGYKSVPEDAECIIIHAPETDFSQDDADKIIEYLNNGGKALITMEYVADNQPNFKHILSEFGLTIHEGCIADNNTANYYQAQIFLLPNVEYADETDSITDAYSYIMAPFAQAIEVPENSVGNITYTKLLTTSNEAVLKNAKREITTFEKEEGDIEGPFCIGVKAQKSVDGGEAVLYAFSSAQLFTDQYDSYVAGNNKQLFSNIMGTIASHEVSVSIPAKSYSFDWLTVDEEDSYVFKAVGIVIVPLTLVFAGLFIWLCRKNK